MNVIMMMVMIMAVSVIMSVMMVVMMVVMIVAVIMSVALYRARFRWLTEDDLAVRGAATACSAHKLSIGLSKIVKKFFFEIPLGLT